MFLIIINGYRIGIIMQKLVALLIENPLHFAIDSISLNLHWSKVNHRKESEMDSEREK